MCEPDLPRIPRFGSSNSLSGALIASGVFHAVALGSILVAAAAAPPTASINWRAEAPRVVLLETAEIVEVVAHRPAPEATSSEEIAVEEPPEPVAETTDSEPIADEQPRVERRQRRHRRPRRTTEPSLELTPDTGAMGTSEDSGILAIAPLPDLEIPARRHVVRSIREVGPNERALVGAYVAYVSSEVHRDWGYPRRALRRGLEGTVTIEIFVDENGAIVSARVVSSSGHEILDEAALEAVASLVGLRPPPGEVSWTHRPIRIPFNYTIS
jgi:protein TonB